MADVCDQTGLQASWSIGMHTGKQGGGEGGGGADNPKFLKGGAKSAPHLLTFRVLTKMASLGGG